MTVDVIHAIRAVFVMCGCAVTKTMYMVRFTPSIDDVNAVALSVLRHRLVTNFSAEAEGVSVDTIIRELTAQK